MEEKRLRWAREQEELQQQVVEHDDLKWSIQGDGSQEDTLQLVGGLDISFAKPEDCRDGKEHAVACLVVLSFPGLQLLYKDCQHMVMEEPYIAGFLAFRECPAYQDLLNRASQTEYSPQVVLVDGFGILHPHGCGSASQLGVLCNIPTIGVGKSLLHVDGLEQKEIRQKVAAQAPALSLPGTTPLKGRESSDPSCAGSHEEVVSAVMGERSFVDASEAAACTSAVSELVSTERVASQSGRVAAAGQIEDQLGCESEIPSSLCADIDMDGLPGVSYTSSQQINGHNSGTESLAGGHTGSENLDTLPELADLGLPLVGHSGKVLGLALRANASIQRPVYVSVGHRISLLTAARLTKASCKFRVPEPIRQADIHSRAEVHRWIANQG